MENGEPIPLWFVLAFVGAWLLVGLLLLYSNFARKRFRLTADILHIETRLLLLRWSITIPRGTISDSDARIACERSLLVFPMNIASGLQRSSRSGRALLQACVPNQSRNEARYLTRKVGRIDNK